VRWVRLGRIAYLDLQKLTQALIVILDDSWSFARTDTGLDLDIDLHIDLDLVIRSDTGLDLDLDIDLDLVIRSDAGGQQVVDRQHLT